jgi:putative AlgH/UPF0301 family transcriptional regulator
MATRDPNQSTLSGQLLVAMPQMQDPRFARSVVYLCAHSADGAMGLVVNRLIDSLSFQSLLAQLGVEAKGVPADLAVHFGGPVESSRGFVLHTSDYHQDSTLVIDDEIALTATVDVLRAIASGARSRPGVRPQQRHQVGTRDRQDRHRSVAVVERGRARLSAVGPAVPPSRLKAANNPQLSRV